MRRRTFDMVEVMLLVTFAVVLAVHVAKTLYYVPPSPELVWLSRTYGPHKQSEHAEEWIIRDYFHDRRDGRFVDVGAAHYRDFSNTWFLEIERHWSGLAVDAQASFADGYRRHRPRTQFANFFVSDVSDATATLFVNKNPWVASSDPLFTARWGSDGKPVQVPTIRLNDLLEAARIESFDLLSMDIELAEPKALAGLDLRRFRPAFVCIEAHPEVRQAILKYFHHHEYVLVGKYLRMDDKNLYFMPAGAQVDPLPADIRRAWTAQ